MVSRPTSTLGGRSVVEQPIAHPKRQDMPGWGRRAWAGAAAIVLDRVAGEPPLPGAWHPVAAFGTAMAALEARVYDDRRAPGVALAAAGAALAAAGGLAVRSATVAGYVSTSGRALHRAALDVGTALDAGDLDGARALLPHLVGRDPSALDGAGIARAVVESVAENTTDAVVAPALWTAAAGSVGAFVHRAGDTLDSMVGYRDDRYRRFGAAAARWDDVLAWAPARATAVLVAAARPTRAGEVARVVRSDAAAHPSPNAGVAEAAFAAALGLRLGGTNRYGHVVEARPTLGRGRPPSPADIGAAVALSRDVSWLLAGLLAAAGAASVATSRRTRGRR
jgi:adenosylcobinamide-phosphate synthase